MEDTAKIKRPKTGGRKKGQANKLTTSVKEAIEVAFKRLGGVEYLVKVGKEEPRAFLAILAKVVPTEVQGSMKFDIAEAILAGRRRATPPPTSLS